ncbi:MAG: hypothetical protein ABRQ39_32940 [Candidatus Eremiobacterota bacterium]
MKYKYLDRSTVRSDALSIRVTEGEKQKLLTICQNRGIKPSDFVRECIKQNNNVQII